MFISMAKQNQLSMTYVKEIARGLSITDLLTLLMKTVKHLWQDRYWEGLYKTVYVDDD